MLGIDPTILAIAALVFLSAGAACYALLFSRIETEKKVSGRISRLASAEVDQVRKKAARDRVQEMSKRRKSVQDNLKDIEKRQQESSRQRLSLKSRLVQAGLSISVGRFYGFSAGFAAFVLLLAVLLGLPFAAILLASAVAGLSIPRMLLGFLVKRRRNRFLDELPNALDTIVRSLRSGLPLNDSIRLVASDGKEPVRSEFARVIEAQQLGLSIAEACARMANHMPLQEVNFFALVISIQSQSGGNLSEALGNLSRVLRDRRRMKAKVKALSMEAKASAFIIGALPFVVALLVYLTSPAYLMVLFSDWRGHVILTFSGIWMSIGILVMRKMVSFDI